MPKKDPPPASTPPAPAGAPARASTTSVPARAKTSPAKAPKPTPKPAATRARKAGKALPVLNGALDPEAATLDDTALSAAWPEAVLALSEAERERRVRKGLDTVLLDEVGDDGSRRTRGFVRAVLRVPLNHPKARVYGVFVELDRAGYTALRQAFALKQEARVWGRLATRLPFLDDAYGSEVCLLEDGSDQRARVVEVKSESLRTGPQIGPRVRRPG